MSLELLATALVALGSVYATAMFIFIIAATKGGLSPEGLLFAASLLLWIFTLAILCLPAHPHSSFGYANVLTALRAGIVCFCAALILFPAAASGTSETVVAFAALALALDAADGWVARRCRQQSAFGDGFDMEVGSLQIFFLSVGVFLLDKAGAWVILIGLLRYALVVAGHWQPRFHATAPRSLRHRWTCIFQSAALAIALLPQVPVAHSAPLAAAALALLIWSLGVHFLYLFRLRGRERQGSW